MQWQIHHLRYSFAPWWMRNVSRTDGWHGNMKQWQRIHPERKEHRRQDTETGHRDWIGLLQIPGVTVCIQNKILRPNPGNNIQKYDRRGDKAKKRRHLCEYWHYFKNLLNIGISSISQESDTNMMFCILSNLYKKHVWGCVVFAAYCNWVYASFGVSWQFLAVSRSWMFIIITILLNQSVYFPVCTWTRSKEVCCGLVMKLWHDYSVPHANREEVSIALVP